MHSLDYFAPVAASDKHASLVDDYLGVPPPGGDFLRKIEDEFVRLTVQALDAASVSLAGVDAPLARGEVSAIEDELKRGKPVLFTGEPGTGKSGVGTMLAEAARKQRRAVLLLDARKVGYVKSDNDFRKHFNLSGSVAEAVSRVARKRGCRVIIDQFDNTAGTAAAEHITNLAVACSEFEGAEVIAISRKGEVREELSLGRLHAAGYVELASHPLTSAIAEDVLRRLGIESASSELIGLCCNLLNLSLVATLKSERPDYDFATPLDEVDLWEGFLRALMREEAIGAQPTFGEHLIAEAVKLARQGLQSDDRTALLDDPRSPAQQRLVSWRVVVPVEESIHRFRHEQLQDFLIAKGATRRGERPRDILAQFDKHRTHGVFGWMNKLYARRPDSHRRRDFLKELFESTEVPFYVVAGVLQRYIRSREPVADALALPIILNALRSQEGLRTYFFRNRPDPAWVGVLWQQGFFDEPPRPRPIDDRYLLPQWDAQNYLFSVAPAVPDLLAKHIGNLRGDCGYAEQAIRTLRFIPGEIAEHAVPKILEWTADYRIGQTLVGSVFELIRHFAEKHHLGAALGLFRSLSAPHPPPSVREVSGYVINGEVVSLSGEDESGRSTLLNLADLLAEQDAAQVVTILEQHLREATDIEAKTRNMSHDHVWAFYTNLFADERSFGDRDYKNDLLRTLRRTLELWQEGNFAAVEPLIERYLSDDQRIWRRLGRYLLQKRPALYTRLVRRELCDPVNLNTLDPDDEFLMLLKNGYPYLIQRERKDLVALISRGLPPDLKRRLISQNEERTPEYDAHIANYQKKWVRDHLAVLREHLTPKPARLLASLIKDVGEPAAPDSPRRFESHFIYEVSPLAEENLSAMSARSLADFAREWQPDSEEHGRERKTYEDLADSLAEVMLLNPGKYGETIIEVALMRYQHAAAMISRLTNTERYPLSWNERILLCERLLADGSVRSDAQKAWNGGWTGVRLSIVRLIAMWIDKTLLPKPNEYLPPEYLVRVRDMLVLSCDDPDPELGDEQLPKGSNEERDHAVVALGHVRPSALSALIRYAAYRATFDEPPVEHSRLPGETTPRLEPVVRETLARKLDRGSDPSWAVHSIFGEFLSTLRWLDEQWTYANLDRIFPDIADERLRWCCVVAWDSYVKHTRGIYFPLFEKLRPMYERAVENMRTGWVTRISHQPARDLAGHLLIKYLHAHYDLLSEAGQRSPIASFFKYLTPDARGDAAWVLWDICNNNKDKLDAYLDRALALWRWRVGVASEADHPTDYDEEINWFTLLLHLAPGRESLSSLWALLEGTLPYIARAEHSGTGWDAVEEFLAHEVERDTLRAIRLYHLMHAERKDAAWRFFPNEKAHKLMRTAMAAPQARQEALHLIDLLARYENYAFQSYIS